MYTYRDWANRAFVYSSWDCLAWCCPVPRTWRCKLLLIFLAFEIYFLGIIQILINHLCLRRRKHIRSWKFTRTRSRSFSFTFSCLAVNCRQRQCSRLKTGNKRVSVSSSSHCPTSPPPPNAGPGRSSVKLYRHDKVLILAELLVTRAVTAADPE